MPAVLDDATLIKKAARRVMRTHHHGIENHDFRQIGWVALLESEQAGKLPSDPIHRVCYLQRRVRGAMLDALRVELRHSEHRKDGHGVAPAQNLFADDDAEDEWCDFGASDEPGPERLAQFSQAAEVFERQASVKVRLAMDMLLQGHTQAEIARFCGVTDGAISRRLDAATKIMERLL